MIGATWFLRWRAAVLVLSPSRRCFIHAKGLIPSAKAAQDAVAPPTRPDPVRRARRRRPETALTAGIFGMRGRPAGARTDRGREVPVSGPRQARPFDDVPMRGGRQPQADAERADEGGPAVAAPIPAEDELVQVTLDVLPAQPVIHDHCPEPRTSWPGGWLPRSFPTSGQRLCSGPRKSARNPMRSIINGTDGMRLRLGQRIADNRLAPGARNK